VATTSYVVRTANPMSLVGPVRRAVAAVDSSAAVAQVRTTGEILDRASAQMAFTMILLAIAAAVALLLGIVGIYGVIAYVASQRTKEIGIRIALGAATRDVTTLFLKQGVLLAGIGIAIGLAAAAATTRVMSTLLYGVGALDPVTYVSVALGLGLTAVLASYIPAARAARIHPAEALRREI